MYVQRSGCNRPCSCLCQQLMYPAEILGTHSWRVGTVPRPQQVETGSLTAHTGRRLNGTAVYLVVHRVATLLLSCVHRRPSALISYRCCGGGSLRSKYKHPAHTRNRLPSAHCCPYTARYPKPDSYGTPMYGTCHTLALPKIPTDID